ncbi:MAG: 50S ribosomal protein L13 [Thermoplasmataceae archaeon]|jgi:large subunit ribosomal protein L13
MIYIDGKNSIYGRLSSYVAKQLLNGEEVTIVNAQDVVITGNRDFITKHFMEERDVGSVRMGPYYPRTPNAILRRSIGQMLPKKKTRGKEALARCMVFVGVPPAFKDTKFQTVPQAANQKMSGYMTLGDVSKVLGLKVKN